MSQSRTRSRFGGIVDPSGESVERVTEEGEIQVVLDALDDPDCRAILDATSDAQLSASTVSERCDLPLSTTYRKLDLLVDAGLLEERTRIRRSGKHTSEYARRVESVVVLMAQDASTELLVSYRESAE